jgi:hypothetical protein
VLSWQIDPSLAILVCERDSLGVEMSKPSVRFLIRSRSSGGQLPLRTHIARRMATAALGLTLAITGTAALPTTAAADEGGVSVWLPGFFGSLAAAPLQPGWSVQTIDYQPAFQREPT